jgi:hypothetical protein
MRWQWRSCCRGIGSDEPNDRLVIALQVLFITLFITLTTPLIQSAEPIDLVGQLHHCLMDRFYQNQLAHIKQAHYCQEFKRQHVSLRPYSFIPVTRGFRVD